MRIIGIDPGLASTGWGVIDHQGSSSRLVASGCIETAAGEDLAQRLQKIHDDLAGVIAVHGPDAAAMEMLFFCTNVRTAVSVAQGRGVAILATAQAQLPFFEYSPLQIKQAVTSSGRADKAQVQRMVHVLLGLPQKANGASRRSKSEEKKEGEEEIPAPERTPPSTSHAADALAVALCHAHSFRFREAASSALAASRSCALAAFRSRKSYRRR